MPTVHRLALISSITQPADVVSTLHLRVEESAPFASVSHADLLDAVVDGLVPEYRAMLHSSASLDEIRISVEPDPSDPGDVPVGESRAVGLAGTRALTGNIGPVELCGCVALKTQLLGRSFRGHVYGTPIMATGQIAAEELLSMTSGYGLALSNFADAIESGIEGGDFWTGIPFEIAFVVYSRTRRARGQSPWMSDITAAIPRNAVYYLRSRGR